MHIHQNDSTLHAQFLNDIAKPPAILVAFASSECFVRCGRDKPHCEPTHPEDWRRRSDWWLVAFRVPFLTDSDS